MLAMKKTATILIIFLYALSSTGFALKADYCCNKLQSLKLILSDYSKDKDGCCKEKYQTFKVKDAHAAADVVNTPAAHVTFIHALSSCIDAIDLSYEVNHHFVNIHAPPLYPTTPVYISNCVFRI
jgi:hypothetical protein